MTTMLSEEMLDWLKNEEELGGEFRDLDLFIKEWAGKVKDMEEQIRIMLGLIGSHVNLDDEMHAYLFGDE